MGMTLALGALAGGTILQAGSSIVQGQQQQEMYDAQAKIAERQAAQEADAAVAQAEKFRKAGKRQAAAADAAYAASGVSVGVGTPVRVNESIQRDAEEDAYMSILTGQRRLQAGQEEAALNRRAGKNAMRAGYMGAATSILQGAATYGMWRGGAGGAGNVGGTQFRNAGGGTTLTAFDVSSRF